MRIPRRPAWPVVFLLASGLCRAGEPVEALSAEINRWRRIQAPAGPGAMPELERAHARATAVWIARWPGEERAWRERLRALERVPAAAAEVEEALAGAARTRGSAPGLRFPEDTRFLMARTAIRHRLRLEEASGWLAEAIQELSKTLPSTDHPLVPAYRRERLSEARWRAAQIRADAAYDRADASALSDQIVALTAESAHPVADPGDRMAIAERARRRSALFLWRARLARLQGARKEAERYYHRALEARPVTPGETEPPENAALIEEASRFTGVGIPPGAPVPPAASAGPHWLPTAQRLEALAPDGRPAVAVVWDGADLRLARALERLERNASVRVLSFPAARSSWIQAVNPLYTAPQLWIVDAEGVIRLIGRFQPGGDGWEHAVTGAALRLERR